MINFDIKSKPIINKSDWSYIRKNIIWASIVQFSIGVALFIQMYYQQKQIIKEIDQLKSDNEALYNEILNIYKKNYAE